MDSWHSYSKVFNFGHKILADLLNEPVLVEEKIDGSQFSFGKFGDKIMVRSRGRVFDVNAPDNLFTEACMTVNKLSTLLHDGWTYRAEYLKSPRHNGLAYDRIPTWHLILFDISTGDQSYLNREDKELEADRIGLEVVPVIFSGKVDHPNELLSLMDCISILGGQKIEGIVVKNYERYGIDGKVLMGKHVSEEFKEVQGKNWKKDQPSQKQRVQKVIEMYRTTARWHKAVQHRREAGELLSQPEDIGPLLKEISDDITTECVAEIKQKLWVEFRRDIMRGVTRGFPEWYKTKLIEDQFGTTETVKEILDKVAEG